MGCLESVDYLESVGYPDGFQLPLLFCYRTIGTHLQTTPPPPFFLLLRSWLGMSRSSHPPLGFIAAALPLGPFPGEFPYVLREDSATVIGTFAVDVHLLASVLLLTHVQVFSLLWSTQGFHCLSTSSGLPRSCLGASILQLMGSAPSYVVVGPSILKIAKQSLGNYCCLTTGSTTGSSCLFPSQWSSGSRTSPSPPVAS